MRKALFIALSLLVVCVGLSGQEAGKLASGEKLVPPQVLKQSKPIYPYSMRRAGIQGEATIGFIVDSRGKVREPYTIRASHPGFREEAVKAVREWKFKAGTVRGKKVNTRMKVPILFRIGEGKSINRWTIKRPKKFPDSVPVSMHWDKAPVLKVFNPPVYPREAFLEKRRGKVKIGFIVHPNGRIMTCRALKGDDPQLVGAAIAAVETFVFQPAMKDGLPCGAVLNMEFEFRRSASSDAPVSEGMYRLEKILKKDGDGLVPISELDDPVKPFYRSEPAIPWEFRESRDAQRVMVEFIINRQGVAELPFVVGEAKPEFAQAAVQAVANWQFHIPRKDDEPVDVRVRVPLEFGAKAR